MGIAGAYITKVIWDAFCCEEPRRAAHFPSINNRAQWHHKNTIHSPALRGPICSHVLETTMRSIFKILPAWAMVVVALCFSSPDVLAQTAADIVGSWSLVSLTVSRSGSEMELLGPHPEGQLIFGSDGHYVLVGVRADLPKFTSGSRLSGTSEMNQKIVEGNVAHFGTYTVDPAGHVIVFHIQRSTFPNWDGDVQQRPFTLVGTRLTYVTPGSFGYGSAKVVWERTK
jgi:hypothetical protein